MTCGVSIESLESNPRQFCSKSCYHAARAKRVVEERTIPCKVCAKRFYRQPSRARGGYCSPECFTVGNVGASNPAFRGGLVTLTCVRCDSYFTRKIGEAKRANAETCSISCSRKLYWDRRGRLDRARPCAHCGAEFRIVNRQSQFCSMRCKNAGHAERIAGDGNGRYVHGLAQKPYPPGWTRTFKAAIRERDGNRCRVCGSPPPAEGPALHIHHIDYVKENLDPTNLISVCKFCHGTMHGGPESRREWSERLSLLVAASPQPESLRSICG
jgi:endogenous inhibitor of DNA gyrase (YacG/DUF329 family)